jgi:hypothetical protein
MSSMANTCGERVVASRVRRTGHSLPDHHVIAGSGSVEDPVKAASHAAGVVSE